VTADLTIIAFASKGSSAATAKKQNLESEETVCETMRVDRPVVKLRLPRLMVDKDDAKTEQIDFMADRVESQ